MSIADPAVHFPIFLHEVFAVEPFWSFSSVLTGELASCRILCHRSFVAIAHGQEESVARLLGRRENRLGGFPGDTEWSVGCSE